jgi:nucleotide-binding universal stress UspA family protein
MKKVLLASDGSSYAEEAAWFLSHLPHAEQLELYVLTVIQVPYGNPGYQKAGAMLECYEREKASAAEAFGRIEQMFAGADVALKHIVREGHRGQAIVDEAREQQVDLIILGARGRSTVRRLLLGSTSDFVATHAGCSVLVVRPTGIRESKRPIQIAFGYEDTMPAQAALEEFSEISWGSQADVQVLSVVSYVSAFLNEIVVESEDIKNAATESVQQAAEQLCTVAPNSKPHLIERDHIGEALVEFVEDHKSDLVVVGETPHTFLGRVLLGSVSRFVLRHAPCSVWLMRNRVQQMAKETEAAATATSS